jgi:hypothetical protein
MLSIISGLWSVQFRSYTDLQAKPPYLWQFPLRNLCRLPYRLLLSNLTVERLLRPPLSISFCFCHGTTNPNIQLVNDL